MTSNSSQTSVLIVGGGVAAIEAALALKHRAGGLVRTTMLAPDVDFEYRPDRVGEPFGRAAAATYPLARIAADIGVELEQDALSWVDPAEQFVHTDLGQVISYGVLLLAVGARLYEWSEHALSIDPTQLDEQLHGLVQDVEDGNVHSVAFVIPSRNTWPLPMYELALQTARRARQMNAAVEVLLVTPEDTPLEILGTAASGQVSQLLAEQGVKTITSAFCVMHEAGRITVHPGDRDVVVDRVVALPELEGPALPGIPRSAAHGFISVKPDLRVVGLEHVYAAGDMTDFYVKHGSIAAQQADTAADSIAILAGAQIVAPPFIPTLYALLKGGERPLYIRARSLGIHGSTAELSSEPLWTPATKIHARYLAPYLESLDRAGFAVR
jgi:sulfide:quinone oxidoreductase